MKLRTVTTVLAATAAASLAACGGGAASTAPVPVATAQSLDTMQVLAQAHQASETGVPFGVDGGALTLSDTADTTDAMPVTGT